MTKTTKDDARREAEGLCPREQQERFERELARRVRAAGSTRSRYVAPTSAKMARLYALEAMDEHEMTVGENDEYCDLRDELGR